MTPEQFVFWLSGFISGQNQKINLIDTIAKVLKEVKTDNDVGFGVRIAG